MYHTNLFDTAVTTIRLSEEDAKAVYEFIEVTVNGDELYETPTKETILEAYESIECGHLLGLDWVDLIYDVLVQLGLDARYGCWSTQAN
jgi:hypothetical protein